MERTITYFESTGPEICDAALTLAKKRAEELGIKTAVVASITGRTAVRAVEILEGMKVIIVRHCYGMQAPNTNGFLEENKKIVESKGSIILTATHALGGITSVLAKGDRPGMELAYVTGDIITMTLRMFGDGTKVACEIAAMAADAGLVRTDEEIVSIAGQHGGTDTALILLPNNAHRFFSIKVREIICKPRN